MFSIDQAKIGVVGLGYVGLPLAVAFGKKFATLGFDINEERIAELQMGTDNTLEVRKNEIEAATKLRFSARMRDISACNVFVIAVPTPIDRYKRPDFAPLLAASHLVGTVLKRGDIVIYESTVYPGATEEVCVPELEKTSRLVFNKDFFVGYSPERINPGDKAHRLETIVKVTSGSTPEASSFVDALYRAIVPAGTHRVTSIRVAEAAKVIENTQRDVNIALVNELAMIFQRLDLDTQEVLDAAATKWNFLPFRPGLVGGHCIGVDPYYLTYKAEEVGYHPAVILAGRRINDNMGSVVVKNVLKLMAAKKIPTVGSKVLVMGYTFKENCPDVRNTRVVDMVREFVEFGAEVEVFDPWINSVNVASGKVTSKNKELEMGVSLIPSPRKGVYDAIVIAVSHRQFRELGPEIIRGYGKQHHVLYDVKSMFKKIEVDGRL